MEKEISNINNIKNIKELNNNNNNNNKNKKIQAIIFANEISNNMQPLGIKTPSILLKISNKTILEYYIENLKDFACEFIIIINKMQEQIIDFCNNKFKNENIIFFEELNEKNPLKSLKNIKKLIKNDFILITKEQIFDKFDVKELIKKKNSILIQENENKNEIDEHNLFFLSKKIIDFVDDYINIIKKDNIIENKIIIFNLIKSNKNYSKIKYSWDLLKINEEINKSIENQIDGIIEQRATIKENIILGKNSIIKNGVYIEGPCVIGENCTIGPNCYIRPYTSIGNNCKIGNAVEIKNSIIMDNTNVGHLSYIGDSIIGKNSNMGAGTITSNLRHDKKIIKTMIDDNLIESDRKKFGTIIGENVHTGIHTSIYPGRKIWPNKSTIPGEIVKNDII